MGITYTDDDKAYYWRNRIGLSDTRLEMLDTATGPDPSYDVIVAHSKRIFRRVHLSERHDAPTTTPSSTRFWGPTRFGKSGANELHLGKSLVRPTFGGLQRGGGGGSSTSSSGGGGRDSSTGRFRPRAATPARPGTRTAVKVRFASEADYIEPDDELHDDVEEPFEPDEDDLATSPPAEEHTLEALEMAVQAELSAAAREAEDLEAAGADQDTWTALDSAAEGLYDSLVTIKVARAKAAAVHRDRGGGFPTGATGALKGALGQGDKKPVCWDCGRDDHFAGSPKCQKPGASPAAPPPGGRGGAPRGPAGAPRRGAGGQRGRGFAGRSSARHAHAAEAEDAEYDASVVAASSMGLGDDHRVHPQRSLCCLAFNSLPRATRSTGEV